MQQQKLPVVRYRDSNPSGISRLLSRYGMQVQVAADGEDIAGSFWGEEEAGLLGNRLVLRPDTPLHSILHETCHYICMDEERRSGLDTDAGGDYDEENAVCYLQILLADEIPGFGSDRVMADMDSWGYTFRLGCTRAWFEGDAEDAREWLTKNGLLTPAGRPTFKLRMGSE
ncbi:MAG: hypothetical protein V2I48_00100 [Xanthomonadales bacterium]|jgi:hypothetical protein|nr:hypothetical protein [Xanthomonadales bacterium]